MSLIKNINADRLVKQAIVLDMGDLNRQAQRILAAARTDAHAELERARSEAERLVQAADARGHAEGLARGLDEGRAEGRVQGTEEARAEFAQRLTELTAGWTGALSQWERDRAGMLHQAREEVIRFAFEVARRVVHRLASSDPTIVRDQVAAALALLARPTAVEVRVHPQDRPLVESSLPDILASVQRCEHAAIREDESVQPGGCVVATAGGHIDATIATQLDRIAEALVPGHAHAQLATGNGH